MKIFTLLLTLFLLSFQTAQADLNGRVNLNDSDDCSLYRALNGSEAVPEECKENDSKSIFMATITPEAPKPVVLDRINFEFNSSRLTKPSRIDLLRLAKIMSNPVSRKQLYEIGGHTDAKGDASYNLKLSQRRAESVKAFLLAHRVATNQLQAQGYGATRLLNTQEPFNLANRRVEIVNITQSGD